MKKRWLIVFVLLCYSAFAQDQLYMRDYLEINLDIENTISIVPKAADYDIKNIKVYLSFAPHDDVRQQVYSLETDPETVGFEDSYLFEWKSFPENTLDYKLNAHIKTYNMITEVKEKINFPLDDLGQEFDEYLKQTESVDFLDPRISSLAQELAFGEDDLYFVVHKFGEWVHNNIQYDLNTKTVEASQKASWVIENRIGVCDEITNLFIGLCRSVGIPARFISGLSYTDDPRFTEKWSPHGWAEVYFPEVGWIPFDVTYGELGYIDPTHIKLKHSNDANKSSTRYEWEARNAELTVSKLKTTTEVIGMGKIVRPMLDIRTDIAQKNVAPGSYNIIEVTLKNNHDFYVPTELSLSKTKEITIFDGHNKFILMRPKQEKTFYFIIKIDDDLKENYIYTFKVNAVTSRKASDEANFTSATNAPSFSLEEIKDMIEVMQEEENKTYSKKITLDCSTERENYFLSEDIKITCTMKNTGTIPLKDVEICMEDECTTEDIGIANIKKKTFIITPKDTGIKKIEISAKNEQISKRTDVIFNVFERPILSIEELSCPEEIGFDDPFMIRFKIIRKNDAPVKMATVTIKDNNMEYYSWDIKDMEDDRIFKLNISQGTLMNIENKLTIDVAYSDEIGRKYSIKKEFSVNLKDVTLLQRSLMYGNRIGHEMKENMQESIIILIGSSIVFGLVIGFIMNIKDSRKRRIE